MMKAQSLFASLMIIFLAGILSPSFITGVITDGQPAIVAPAAGQEVSSGSTSPANEAAHRQLEERILRSTVRIYIETWRVRPDESGYDVDTTVSHATLKDGRFLVTHNHFSVPLSGDDDQAYRTVTLANSDGQALFMGTLSDFELVWEDPQTLVLAYKDDDSLFEKLGFVSAEFKDWSSLPLEPGMEVAQVDWDGSTTRVDWTTVQEVDVEDGVPRLVLADSITLGASGGGVFWQGEHIANNWLLVQELGASDELLHATTKVALNSVPVSGPVTGMVTADPTPAIDSGRHQFGT